jgi:threonine dehydrogenase-like Zn-dependent dehydrogenase
MHITRTIQLVHTCINNLTCGCKTKYIAIHWKDLFVSDKLSLRELALVEPLTVGFHASSRGRISREDCVAVIGCGIVGMGAIASAVNRGANVIAIDIDEYKMEIAKKIGATHTINSSKVDLHQALSEITNGDGPDVIIEAVGNSFTYRAAVEEVAYTGRVVCIGYAKSPVEFNTGLFVRKEIEILGSRNCTNEFPEVIEYLEKGKFPVDDVISMVVSIDEAGAALQQWSTTPAGITKIMVDLEK